MNNKLKAAIIGIFLLFFSVNFSLAEIHVVPDTGSTKYEEGEYELNDFLRMGENVYKIILGVVGSLTLLMFVYGGLMFLVSAGNTEKVSKAKGILMAAVVGLIIVFASYIIIEFVMKALGVNWSGGAKPITN